MDGVQIENGYTRIANEILEALAITSLNGTQRRILDVVFRQTFGFQRKNHDLSITFIAKATKIHKMQIQRELAFLIQRNIISVVTKASFSKSRVIAFNKNYSEWGELDTSQQDSEQLADSLTLSILDNHTVSELANSTVSGLANQRKKKENTKETHIDIFFNSLWGLYPNKKGKSRVSAKQRKLLFEEYGEEKLRKAILKYTEETQGRDPKFIQHGSTFFNGGFEDYLPQEKEAGRVIAKKGNLVVMTDAEIERLNDELARKSIEKPLGKERFD